MRRRQLLLSTAVLAVSGCTGGAASDEPTPEPTTAPPTTTAAPTATPTPTPAYPPASAFRVAIRNEIDDTRKRLNQSFALEVNGTTPSTLRSIATDHAAAMADSGRLELRLPDSDVLQRLDDSSINMQVQVESSSDRYTATDLVFLAHLDPPAARAGAKGAASAVVGGWLDDAGKRPVLLDSHAHFLGLGLALGAGGLYVTAILD